MDNHNAGDGNEGSYNSGDSNVGDFNAGSNNIGCFCTEERTIRIFDIETEITLNQWLDSEAYKILSKITVVTSTLKLLDTTATYSNFWNSLTKKEKDIIKSIPNFDAKKFKQITGITIKEELKNG